MRVATFTEHPSRRHRLQRQQKTQTRWESVSSAVRWIKKLCLRCSYDVDDVCFSCLWSSDEDVLVGRKHILDICRSFMIIFLTKTNTILIRPSVPGCIFCIRPNNHCPGPQCSSEISTKSPILPFSLFFSHFKRA